MSLDNVGTPWRIFNALELDLVRVTGRGFQRDVCAEPWSAKCPNDFLTREDDGLAHPWLARNFCNSEYHEQAKWMRRAAWMAEEHKLTTACLVRAAQDTRYWFRLATSRGTTDFYVGRIAFIAPPEGVTLKHKVRQPDGTTKKVERFIPGGEPIPGTDFPSAVVWYGPDFAPGVVRWRDAETGELIDVRRARELRGMEARA
jgi:hypothetical protein